MYTKYQRWTTEIRGTIVVPFAIALPVLLLMIGSGFDYAQAITQRQRLQMAIDEAALSSSRELGLSDARRENVAAVVRAVVEKSIAANGESRAPAPVLDIHVQNRPLEVQISARQGTVPYFGGAFGFAPVQIEVNTVARIIGQPNICVLALDTSANGTIALEKDARVTGNNCAVFSNSTHSNGLKSKNSAVLTASMICTAGGKDGGRANFMPSPMTDCPTFTDPLAGRPEPVAGACDSSLPTRVTSSRRLSPGTYCGGLEILDGAVVELDPGIYIFKDGRFRVGEGASVTGQGVGFFMTGTGAVVRLEQQSTINLAAPNAGAMAGLLFFEARNQPTSGVHNIFSDNARNLLGTLYLSRGRLHVDANNPIADQSAYTAIVARMLTLHGGPHLVLNTNYDLTDVPVPEGIKGASQPVALVR